MKIKEKSKKEDFQERLPTFRNFIASLLENMLTGKGIVTAGYRDKKGKRIV